MTSAPATISVTPHVTSGANAPNAANAPVPKRAGSRPRAADTSAQRKPAIWRDIAVIASVATTGAAVGMALNIQSGVAPWIAAAIAVVAASIMVAIHALVRSTGSVAELDAEVQSLRKEVRRLAPNANMAPNAGSRRAASQPTADVGASPVVQPLPVPMPVGYVPPPKFDTAQAFANDGPPAHSAEGYGEPQMWPAALPTAEHAHLEPSGFEPAGFEHANPEPATGAYAPTLFAAPHQDSAPDLEFERLQHLIRKLAEETTGPRANIANMEAAGAVPAMSSTARPPRTLDRSSDRTLDLSGSVRAVATNTFPTSTRRAGDLGTGTEASKSATPERAVVRASPPHGGDQWRTDLSPALPSYGTLNHAAARQESGLAGQMSEAITAGRVDVLLTPVQGLADRKAHHYEISVRLKLSDGVTLDHGALSSAARTSGLGGRLDALRLSRVARVARHVERRSQSQRVLSTFIGTSLAEDAFLEAVAEQLGTNPAARIVMGFSQADVRAFGPAHWDTIETMSDMGIGFALEDVTDLDIDFAQLKSRGFAFVKLDASVFLEGLPAANGPVPSADICQHLSKQGLALIVGEIEDEWALAKIMGLGVVYGQGVMFGAARPVKPEILEAG
jgi:cyclic-di-GMP phosphodiesterase, flagellum assembly factor TipF